MKKMKMKFLVGFSVGLFTLVIAGMANAVPMQWSSSVGGNDHWYDAIASQSLWEDAKIATEQIGGYLATMTSADENQFIVDTFLQSNIAARHYWLGGYQLNNNSEPAGNWAWVTGEQWNYTNWTSLEPNNIGGDEDYLQFYMRDGKVGAWNDLHVDSLTDGFFIEYDTAPSSVPEPATILLVGMGLAGLSGVGMKKKKMTNRLTHGYVGRIIA